MTAILPLAAFARRKASPVPLRPVQAAAWRPGLGEGTHHAEVFAAASEGSGAGLALALALDAATTDEERPFLWVQDAAALRLGGRPYRPGLPAVLRHRLIHVAAKSPEDALFALEEGLRCRDLAFVLGEVAGNPRALDFTASRRLSLAAEKHGTPLWLVRLDARRDLSSARMRWAARAAPSPPPRWNAEAPGTPAWQAELFRARGHPPGEWVLREEGGLTHNPLPGRGEGTQAWRGTRLAAVGEGFLPSPAPSTPLQASLAPAGASCATLSPQGERVGA
jgi:protein ImuA